VGADVALIGPAVDLTMIYDHLADSPVRADELLKKDHADIREILVIVVGMGALPREDGAKNSGAAMGAWPEATNFRLYGSCTPPHPVWARWDIGAVLKTASTTVAGRRVIYNLGRTKADIPCRSRR